MNKALLIHTEKVLDESRAAAWRGNDEHGLADALAPEAWKEKMIQSPCEHDKSEEEQKKAAEQNDVCPAPDAEGQPKERQVFRFQE